MKSHRGIAAIVGIVFLVAVVVVALGYITYSLETMANFSETLIAEESRQKNIQDEEFQITSVDITSDKLDATIKNTGQIPLKIDTLYIDEQGINDIVQKIVIDKTIAPGGSIGLIDESFDIDVNGTKGYTLKMITSSGESQIFYVNSASTEPLFMNLITAPQTISSDFSATILFTVVNNMSNNNRIYNLVPEISVESPNGLATYQSITGPRPTSYPVLDTGDVAIFEYVYTVAGDEGNSVNFGLSLVDGYEISPGNIQHLNTTIAVKVVEIALKSGS